MAEIAITTSGKWIGESDHCVIGPGHTITKAIGPSTDVAIVGTAPIYFQDIKHLKGIVRLGVGYDNVPRNKCRSAGIILGYTPNAPSQSVAEHALALMMCALRFRTREHPGKTLAEISVAIIGRGRIGKRFASILHKLGVSILAVDPICDTTFDEIHGVTHVSLDIALECADVVSLHVPYEDATHRMINRESLKCMKKDATLINTSRGPVINEKDLMSHLKKNPEFAAALDVFCVEPYKGPLRGFDNCICTPHVSSMTVPARKAMEREAIIAAMAIINGDRPRWEIPVKEPWHV